MAPTAARRARQVQRNDFQGLQGNPDACRPRRGSACNIIAWETGGDACPVFALFVQPTAAISPRTWGVQGGRSPPALLSPHFFGKKWGRPPRRRPSEAGPLSGGRHVWRPYGLGQRISAPGGYPADGGSAGKPEVGAATLGGPFRPERSRAAVGTGGRPLVFYTYLWYTLTK